MILIYRIAAPHSHDAAVLDLVGVAGFEPAAHWSQTSCATKLRYTPIKLAGAVGLEPTARGFGDRCSTN